MITLKQAKALKIRDIIHSEIRTNASGACQRWRVNGKPKTWKRQPERVQVPLKYGMYEFDYLYESDLNITHRERDCEREK